MISVGIDCTSSALAFTYAALDSELRMVNLAEVAVEDLLAFIAAQESVRIAVNAPSHVNTGVVRRHREAQRVDSHSIRGAEIRQAEQELNSRGIAISGTPRLEALCPGWVQLGFSLYRRLAALRFQPFPAAEPQLQWVETHPHAGFCALLGRLPLPKPTLEGRLQRALVLFEHGVRIHDPMAFLEEITRHRLLHGLLPMEAVLTPEQLDAVLAAYTAWLTVQRPADVMQVGNKSEGFITLPVSSLQDRY